MTIPLVLAGHSHGYALGIPVREADANPQLVAIDRGDDTLMALAAAPQRDGVYWDALVHAARERTAAIVWGGGQYRSAFAFLAAQPFDFVLSSDQPQTVARAVPLVPEAMVRAVIAPSFDPLAVLLERLRESSRCPAIVVGTPPPAGRREPDADEAAPNVAAISRKLWQLEQNMAAEMAQAQGAAFVPVPDRLMTQNGFLRNKYAEHDSVHANAAFGAQLLGEVIAAAGTMAAPAPAQGSAR